MISPCIITGNIQLANMELKIVFFCKLLDPSLLTSRSSSVYVDNKVTGKKGGGGGVNSEDSSIYNSQY